MHRSSVDNVLETFFINAENKCRTSPDIHKYQDQNNAEECIDQSRSTLFAKLKNITTAR